MIDPTFMSFWRQYSFTFICIGKGTSVKTTHYTKIEAQDKDITHFHRNFGQVEIESIYQHQSLAKIGSCCGLNPFPN